MVMLQREKTKKKRREKMGIITGIAATIIAGVKGRTTYAWVMGIWTVLGLITSLVAGFGIAPGIIFLIIAIGLKKAGTETNENQSAQNAIPKEQLEEAKKFICDSCGFLGKGWYQECPECGAKGKMRKGSDAEIIEWNHIVLPGDQAPDTQAE